MNSEKKTYLWSFADRISIAVINFGVNIALVRMLTEADFGLLAMIAIFIAIASDLSSCGLSDGLVHKARPTETDYSTVFVFNAGIGLIFGLIFFFSAPLVADFFGHDELTGIMRVLGVCFFFQTMSYVQETRLRKQLKMRTLFFARVGATVTVSALGIFLAANGYGYKALICTQLLLSVFFFIYYTIGSRWFPRIRFSVRAFKEFFSYGIHLAMAYLATLTGKNINTFTLGRIYNTPAVSGVYYQGAKLANVPFSILETSVNSTFFVIASNEEDRDRQNSLIRNMFFTLLSFNTVLLMFMLAIAGAGIELLYGQRWLAAIPVFRILAFAELLVCIRAFFTTVCKIHARTRFVRNMGFAEVGFQLAMLLIFYRYGILWIAATQVMGVSLALTVYAVYCRRFIGMSFRDYATTVWSALWLPLLSACGAAALSVLVPWSSPLAGCCIITAGYAGIFIAAGAATKARVYTLLLSRLQKKHKQA